ncbi:hypothetical protein FEE95_18715 [Maribacter algarum]|uniref:Uncharacterized protein n=1 Tax=Maribacter algarum (ex Zhang et al. 2020) TaxID=2578118 RepID=A0A5S3PI54_9FLAO|nr:hypothetical protein [Maribacter algarum]TMM53927.1 hypothetical protein FEE95_18715 [Maribacter algarum]
MKKILCLGILALLFSCDDGDLQIETIDFDSATIQNCDAVSAETANVLFKLNTSEALILELPSGAIKNEVSDGAISTAVTASGPARATYRTFSDNVSTNYFCNDIPLTEPTVIEEIIAQGGEVLITTTLNADGVTYEHEIRLNTISFVTSNDSRITNLAIDNFGTVTTTLSE